MIEHPGTEDTGSNHPGKAEPAEDPTRALVIEIARALVDNPEMVKVEALAREETTVLRLHVSDADIGKVIGKQGRTAHSLRTILSAVSMKYNHRYTLDIVETAGSPGGPAGSQD